MRSVYSLNHLPNNGKVHNKLSETSEKADSNTRNSHFVGWGDLGSEKMKCFFHTKKTVI